MNFLLKKFRTIKFIRVDCENCHKTKKRLLSWGHANGQKRIRFCTRKCQREYWLKRHKEEDYKKTLDKPRKT